MSPVAVNPRILEIFSKYPSKYILEALDNVPEHYGNDTQAEYDGQVLQHIVRDVLKSLPDCNKTNGTYNQDFIARLICEALEEIVIPDSDTMIIYFLIIENILYNRNVSMNWARILGMIASIADYQQLKWSVIDINTATSQSRVLEKGVYRISENLFLYRSDEFGIDKYFLSRMNDKYTDPTIAQHLVRNIQLTGEDEQLLNLPQNVEIKNGNYLYTQGCLIDLSNRTVENDTLSYSRGEFMRFTLLGYNVVTTAKNKFSMQSLEYQISKCSY